MVPPNSLADSSCVAMNFQRGKWLPPNCRRGESSNSWQLDDGPTQELPGGELVGLLMCVPLLTATSAQADTEAPLSIAFARARSRRTPAATSPSA